MALGIIFVSCGMVLQTLTYCLVKETARRVKLNVGTILVNAHIIMGLICLPLFFMLQLYTQLSAVLLINALLVNITYLGAQFCMFSAIARSDASAASPYLILKLPLVALLSITLLDESLTLQQSAALLGIVILSLIYTNAIKISFKVLGLVLGASLCFALCDIFIIKAAHAFYGFSALKQGIATVVVCDSLLLAMLLPFVLRRNCMCNTMRLRLCTPLALSWISGVATTVIGFNLAGIISGNIILSLRALCAIILVALFFRAQLYAPGRFYLKSAAACGLCLCVIMYYG